ncbi:MAG: TylF/MycF/NovP-related O-methyltransferase [Pseudomonadota bacterium]
MSDPFVPGGPNLFRYVGWVERILGELETVRLGKRFGVMRRPREAVLLTALDHALQQPGVILEFGVFQGRSITAMAERAPDRRFVGFDSFEGFPPDGRIDWEVDFAVDGTPAVPQNVALHKGWFRDTLPRYLKSLKDPVAMVHIDCDIYSSTYDALWPLARAGHFKPGLVLVCDDAINYPGFPFNELLSVYDVLRRRKLDLVPLAVHDKVRSIVDTLRMFQTGTHPPMDVDSANGFCQQAAFVVVERTVPEQRGSEAAVALFDAELGTRRYRRELAGAEPTSAYPP